MSLPTLTDGQKKYDRTTMAIRSAGESADTKAITLNNLSVMKSLYLTLFCLLLCTCVYGLESQPIYNDSLTQVANSSPNLRSRAQAMWRLAASHSQDSIGKHYTLTLDSLAKAQKDDFVKGLNYLNKSTLARIENKSLVEADSLITKAISLLKKESATQEFIIEAHYVAATIYGKHNRTAEAVDYFFKNIRLLEAF